MTKPARIYLSPPHMGPSERELLLEAFDSNWIAPLGPHVDAFEREFAAIIGCEHAVALSSGTAALHLALILAGIQPDDEIATSTLTFVATANAVRYVGAKPVFIDSQASDWNLDPNLLEEELASASKRGKPIKAVLAVDILGQCAAYEPLLEICARFGIPLIEDAAEGLGATYRGRAAGNFGEFGAFSFNGNKIITTSGGGMLVTQNEELAQRARFLATQARDPAPHYEHSVVGYNYRLSNLLAAIGRGQLHVLSERVAKRCANFAYYHEHLSDIPGIDWMPEPADCFSTRWLTCITVDPKISGVSREEIRLALEAENIEARAVWKPLHRQPAYQDCRARGGAVSERLFETGLCLPSGSSLVETDLARITAIIRRTLGHSAEPSAATATRPSALPKSILPAHAAPSFAKAGGST